MPSCIRLPLLIQIVENASKYPSKAVVVTGGEPLLYNLDYLTAQLTAKRHQNFYRNIRRLSPFGQLGLDMSYRQKNLKRHHAGIAANAHELKVIVFNKSDFAWAEEHAKMVSPDCKLYLQPEWSKSKEMTPLIVDYVMNNPQWEISLQTHKYLNIP